ncbi:MAG: NAD(P)H-hydrate dehydratase [Armatimonadota bacterium]
MKLCTGAQMREIDRLAVEQYGMPSLLLMENAGRAVAERAAALLRDCPSPTPRVVVLCGKGNNGGDGFVAARHLYNRGYRVECLLAADRAGIQGDAAVNLALLERLRVSVRPFPQPPDQILEANLLIDALLGTGFSGQPRGAIAEAIRAANRSGISVLAVDIPSGVEADTGRASGTSILARETVTFGLPKLGLAVYPARARAGQITVAEISLPRPLLEDVEAAEWITPARGAALWPDRAPDAHKGEAGRVFVLAGSPGLTGAATLCCEGALRAGAGLVTLGVPASLNPILEVKLTEAMTVPLPETPAQRHCPESLPLIQEHLQRAGALAAGPGFGRDAASGELLRTVLRECPVPAVVDADGLTLLAPADAGTFPARTVITPHPGEMARLLGTDVESVQSNRVEIARRAAERLGCVVLLKGAGTIIAAPDGRLAVNSSGSAALATGGTGDVLTGVTAACLARGLEPFEAAAAAAYLHGLAGEIAEERFGTVSAVAGDVAAALPQAFRRLRDGNLPGPCRTV